MHYPVQIKLVAKNCKLSCIAYDSGLILISDLAIGKVCFHDYLGVLTPKIPDKKAGIGRFLNERGVVVAPKASLRELKSKAKEYVQSHKKNDNTLIKVAGVTAMEFYVQDLVYLASTKEKTVFEVSLTYSDFAVAENILKQFPFHTMAMKSFLEAYA